MDPLTQAAVGAALPTATRHRKHVAVAALFGGVAGMAPDLDILIRSDADPLLFLQYHRQFTHSFVFIPIGAALCAGLLFLLFGRHWRLTFKTTWALCALGYATHALLDAATSYGTMLLWPFSDTRFAWSIISIIDPLFTVPIVVLVATAAVRRKPGAACLALLWAGIYLSLGYAQHMKAAEMASDIAASRGHDPDRLEVKPSFGNIVLWKSIYEADGRFYVDAVRARLSPKIFVGTSVEKLDIARDLPWLDPVTQHGRDVARFTHFSDGFVALDPNVADRIIDVRYSFVPNQIAPLWSIQLDPDASLMQPVAYVVDRKEARRHAETLWSMITRD